MVVMVVVFMCDIIMVMAMLEMTMVVMVPENILPMLGVVMLCTIVAVFMSVNARNGQCGYEHCQ